ncbi:MAG TPA: hypothetical protein PKC29_12570 [Thermodesulfobacteriota bacterium]|nr:hypothetical protein [Thermodesulfobacteriota bacterium]
MTHNRTWLRLFIFTAVFVFVAGAALDAYSRGGRGGGRGGGGGHRMSGNRNISRSGPARSGSMRSSNFNRGSRSSEQMSRSGSSRQLGQGSHQQARQKAQDFKANNPDAAQKIQDNRGDRQDDRQDWKDQNREDWQQYGRNARNDRQEYYEHHDYYEYHDDWEWGENVEYPYAAATVIALGTALTVSAFNSLTCTPTVVTVGAVTYYQCGPNWYNQAYQNGDVVYMSVAAPPGY